MIDLHSHVLPGLDDGAETLDESVAICEAAAADGITVLAATPHVRASDYPTTPQQMEEAFARVRDAARGIVELVPGGELDLAEVARADVGRFALGGGSYLLVETPYTGWPLDIQDKLFRLRVAGHGVVLAHPERNGDVQARPELVEPLVASGVLVQLTAASVDGRLGSRARRAARTLLDRRLAHLIASDAHGPAVRAIGMKAASLEVDEDLARWLTEDVPRAILEGTTVPPRPDDRPRRRWFRRA